MLTKTDLDTRAMIREIAENSAVSDALYLVSKGVPFDVAFSLDDVMRTAWCIILGTHDGGEFLWESMSWRRKE